MTSQDLPAFEKAFQTLRQVFYVKGDDVTGMQAGYFKALRGFGIDEVKSGAQAWLSRGKRFPKPADWIECIPRRALVDARRMSETEARDYRKAELAGYEGEPCNCEPCVRAGVDWKPTRFVPEVDEYGRDAKAFDPILNRVVVPGYWAHGQELAAYYRAKGEYYEAWLGWIKAKTMDPSAKPKQSFAQQLDEIFAPRKVTAHED